MFSTCVKSGVLLDVAELFEPSLAVGTLVRFLAGMDANVLDQLVVGAERLETLLTLVRFAHFQAAAAQRTAADAAGPAEVASLHLHGRRLLHEYLWHKRNAGEYNMAEVRTDAVKAAETMLRS